MSFPALPDFLVHSSNSPQNLEYLAGLAGTCVLVSYLCHALNAACCRGHSSSLPEPAGELGQPFSLGSRGLQLSEAGSKPTLPAAELSVPVSKTGPIPRRSAGCVHFQHTLHLAQGWEHTALHSPAACLDCVCCISFQTWWKVPCHCNGSVGAAATWHPKGTAGEWPWSVHSTGSVPTMAVTGNWHWQRKYQFIFSLCFVFN